MVTSHYFLILHLYMLNLFIFLFFQSKLYPGDKDIMFRRSYEDSWKDIDTVSNSHAHLDSLTKSWPADKADSISRYHQDSDLSDEVIDYTTFLEQTALKKQHEVKTHERQVNQATEFLNDNDNVVVETIVEEEFTSFPSQIQPSTHSESDVFLSESTDRVYSQVQDLTGKARPVVNSHTNSNASSSSHSSPIYSTVDKRSRSSRSESFGSEKISGVMGNGIYSSNSNKSHNDGDRIESDVIASQIKRLEARKSHLGSWEITRMAEDSLSTKSEFLFSLWQFCIFSLRICFFAFSFLINFTYLMKCIETMEYFE